MVEGFQGFLIEKGYQRIKWEHPKKKQEIDNDSLYVSAYGPIAYGFVKDGKTLLHWGLGIVGRGPYYFLPQDERHEVIISDNYELELERLLTGTPIKKEAKL